MVEMNDVRKFSEKIVEKSDRFEVMDESEVSRIVVLQNKKRFTERYLTAYA
jgi:tRNA wybutosine-synthesizing protein 1